MRGDFQVFTMEQDRCSPSSEYEIMVQNIVYAITIKFLSRRITNVILPSVVVQRE